jgi:hypothetical protein
MPGLPSNVDKDCRTILGDCDQFLSYRSLRDVFVTEHLFPFRPGLPFADSPVALVDGCLGYLIDKRLSNGYPVLPIFISALSVRYPPENELYHKLQSLYEAVRAAMIQPDTQPVQPPHHAQQLFDLLLNNLDFDKQVSIANRVIENHHIASFLVHGGPGCGQRILVNRLIQLSPGWQTGQLICVDAGGNGIGKSSHSLWRQVANKLNIPTSTRPAQVAERICDWWSTQDVIFVFNTVDYMPPTILSEWIHEFWRRLVRTALSRLTSPDLHVHTSEIIPEGAEDPRLAQPDLHHLLMFLVDYGGSVCSSSVPLARQSDEPEYPFIPLLLPPADRFPPDVLNFWINKAAKVLPAGLTTQVLLADSENGIPQLIYETICDQCGLSWEGDLTKWLI